MVDFDVEQSDHFFNKPNALSNIGFHCRRDAQGFVNMATE